MEKNVQILMDIQSLQNCCDQYYKTQQWNILLSRVQYQEQFVEKSTTCSTQNMEEFDGYDFLDLYQENLYEHQLEALTACEENDRGILSCFCGTGKSKIIQQLMLKEEGKILIVFPSLALIQQFCKNYLTNEDPIILSSESKQKMQEDFSLVITTYQSLHKLKDFMDQFDLVLLDEAHHICTKAKIALLNKVEGRMYFFTATPQANKQLNMYSSSELCGGIIYEFSFTDALQSEIVCDYYLNFTIFKYDLVFSLEQQQFSAIISLAQQENRKRIIIFNSYVNVGKFNKSTCAQFQQQSLSIKVISACSKNREEVFEWFQQDDDEMKIICNVACIKEGIDLPCVDMIVFSDEKKSKIQIIQAIGRGTRRYQGKENVLITAMIALQSHQEIDDQVVFKDKFSTVTHILCALKDQDKRIMDVMQGKVSTLKFSINCKDFQFENFQNKIMVELSKEVDLELRWMQKYEQLKEFLEKNDGKYPKRNSKNIEEYKISQWIHNLKYSKKSLTRYRLNLNKIQLLEKLPNWEWELDSEKQWLQKYEQVKEFLEKNNEKYPCAKSLDKFESKLGTWISNQRKFKNNNNKCMTQEKQQLLQILPEFFWKKDLDKIWNEKYQQLKLWIQQYNKYPINHSQNKLENQLVTWLGEQKMLKKNNRKKLTLKRQQLLEQLPKFVWKKDIDQIWNQQYQKLLLFIEKNQIFPKWTIKDLKENKLKQWIEHQKQYYIKQAKCLTKEKIQKLNSIENWIW